MKLKEPSETMWESFKDGLHEDYRMACPKPMRLDVAPDQEIKPKPPKTLRIKENEDPRRW